MKYELMKPELDMRVNDMFRRGGRDYNFKHTIISHSGNPILHILLTLKPSIVVMFGGQSDKSYANYLLNNVLKKES